MFIVKPRSTSVLFVCTVLALLLFTAGCAKAPSAAKPLPVVKAIEIKTQSVPIVLEFVGQIEPQQEVQIKANVSGQIVERLAPAGQMVAQGQPLFRIDPQPYEIATLDAQGQLAESQAALSQQRQNVARLQRLIAINAISQQEYDDAVEQEKQLLARVHSASAKLDKTNWDVTNTLVVAPISGRMDTSNLAVGNYIQQGVTTLATIAAVDPVLVKFSLSESEYLRFTKIYASRGQVSGNGNNLEIVLEDGTIYPEKGNVTQIERGLSSGTGTLTVKAQFANPRGILLAGMFATVRATSQIRTDAILVPQRAVQDLMGKSMITVVGADGTVEVRAVTTGPRMGSLWLIEKGLQPGEKVVVEGVQNARQGQQVNAELVDIEQFQQKKSQ